jgi:hypothetical protein
VERVNIDNFVRAETNRMFASLAPKGRVNKFFHRREPASVDAQPVIRMNRDTLYSMAVVDLAGGASVTLPDAGERYLSAMILNQDHYVTEVLHEPGRHDLDPTRCGTRYVVVGVRVLADPADADDLAIANGLQDQLEVEAASAEPFVMPDYDQESFDGIRKAVLRLGKYMDDTSRAFGRPDEVDPVTHLLGTAAGWGGLPQSEAVYLPFSPDLPVGGTYRLEMRDVPVNGFWSVSVYNADGFFEPNEQGAYSVNDLTAEREGDGRTVHVHFGNGPAGSLPNLLPITEGWNYVVRLYRPRPAVIDHTWRPAPLETLS